MHKFKPQRSSEKAEPASKGRLQAAVDAFNNLINDYPQSTDLPYAFFSLGQAYSAMERYSEAADAYLNYLVYRSGVVDAYVLNLRADALRNAGDFVGATNDYRAALESPSLLDSIELEIKLAHTHAIAGDYGTAIAMYQDIYNRAASDYTKAQLDLYIGQAYTGLGKWRMLTLRIWMRSIITPPLMIAIRHY
jgi:tetratricopeptide (TPR) repeat protein